MESFERKLLRLKDNLSIHKDKDIAEILGMSPTAFNGRKKRGLFPEDKLLALVAKRPDLGIDVHYVLTGERKPSEAFINLMNKFKDEDDGDESRDDEPFTFNTPATYRLSKDEWELMKRFRVSSLEIKMQVMQLLMSVDMTGKTPDDDKPEPLK